MSEPGAIKHLHDEYARLTGLVVPLTLPRIYAWEAWIASKHTAADLALVVGHLRTKIHDRGRLMGALSFHRLIEMLDWFDEDLAEARALARRHRVPPNREAVLRATGRKSEPPPTPARSVGEILAAEAALRRFLQVRDES